MTEKDDPYLKLSSPFDSISVICETRSKETNENFKTMVGIILKHKQNDGRWK